MSIKEKIETIATKIYGADGVTYSPEAEKAIANIEKIGIQRISCRYGKEPVLILR